MSSLIRSTLILAALLLCALVSRGEDLAPRFTAASLYNQGNAFARGGKPGMAVLNYERARLLAPNDADIAANLHTVLEAQHLVAPARSWLERVASLQAPSTAAATGLLGLLLLGAAILSGRWVASRWVRAMGATAGLVLLGMPLAQGIEFWPMMHAGVIIARAVPVRESPVPMAEVLFVLPEAESVTVAEEYEHFALIKTRAGRVGWVAAANLVRVVPAHSKPSL